MLTIHHLRVSQSERIVWLCEELGISYELKCYDRDPPMSGSPPAYKALHPAGGAPIVADDGLVLAESGAIVDYIVARHGGGRLAVKPGAVNYPDYIYWFHYANGTLQPSASLNMILGLTGLPADNPLRQGMADRFTHMLGTVDTRLGEAPFLAGDQLTAADIMIVFTLTTMRYFYPYDLSACPHILAYLQRIGARPAYRTAMDKGDAGMTPLLS